MNKILTQKKISNELELLSMFVFLVMNMYVLGPRITREFFIHVFGHSPRISEKGMIDWEKLLTMSRALISDKNITYHDIIGNKPLTCKSYLFNSNIKRIYEQRSDNETKF